MAKIAGRKNDGAWQRFNDWIVKQPAATLSAFAEQLEQNDPLGQAYTAITAYIIKTGVARGLFPPSPSAWAEELSVGIPRQIWEGVTTYDTYTDPGGGDYKKDMQPTIFRLSKDVRKIAKLIRFGSFEVKHLAGLTHPSSGTQSLAVRAKDESKDAFKARLLIALRAYRTEQASLIAAEKSA